MTSAVTVREAEKRSPPETGPDARSSIDTSRKLYVYLCAIFVSCLILGDVIGGKFIHTPVGVISVGIIPFPVTFLLTDVVNDFYGRAGARSLTILGFWMAVLAWVILQLATYITPDPTTYFSQTEFSKIFGGSAQLFVASIIAYLIGQFLDIQVFQFWKALTESKHLWLRATGSTILSQMVDTVTINVIFLNWSAVRSPDYFLAKLSASEKWTFIFAKIGREYTVKLVVAILLTPAIYALHEAIVKGLKIEPEPHMPRKK